MGLSGAEAPLEPGWYPDPDGAHPDQLRYFDGRVWTDRWVRKTTLDPGGHASLSPTRKLLIAALLGLAATSVLTAVVGAVFGLHEDREPSVPVPSISQR